MFYLETNKFRLQAGKYWEISKSRPVTHHCYALSVKYVFCNYKHIMCVLHVVPDEEHLRNKK